MSVIIKEKYTLPKRHYDLMLNWCYQTINTQNQELKDKFYRKRLLINEYVEETKSMKEAYRDNQIIDLAQTILPGCNGGILFYSFNKNAHYDSFKERPYLGAKIIYVNFGKPFTLINKKTNHKAIVETGEVIEIIETGSDKYYKQIYHVVGDDVVQRFGLMFWIINPNSNSKVWVFSGNKTTMLPSLQKELNKLISNENNRILLSDNSQLPDFNQRIKNYLIGEKYPESKILLYNATYPDMAKTASKGLTLYYEITNKTSSVIKIINQKVQHLKNLNKDCMVLPIFNISSESKNEIMRPLYPDHIKVGANLSSHTSYAVQRGYAVKQYPLVDNNHKEWIDVNAAFNTFRTGNLQKDTEIMIRILTNRFQKHQVLLGYIKTIGGIRGLENCCSFHEIDHYPGQKQFWDGYGSSSRYIYCLIESYKKFISFNP